MCHRSSAADARTRLAERSTRRLEVRIEQTLASDDELAGTVDILRSVPGIGPVASTLLIAEMPELGQLSGEQAAALAAWL